MLNPKLVWTGSCCSSICSHRWAILSSCFSLLTTTNWYKIFTSYYHFSIVLLFHSLETEKFEGFFFFLICHIRMGEDTSAGWCDWHWSGKLSSFLQSSLLVFEKVHSFIQENLLSCIFEWQIPCSFLVLIMLLAISTP